MRCTNRGNDDRTRFSDWVSAESGATVNGLLDIEMALILSVIVYSASMIECYLSKILQIIASTLYRIRH